MANQDQDDHARLADSLRCLVDAAYKAKPIPKLVTLAKYPYKATVRARQFVKRLPSGKEDESSWKAEIDCFLKTNNDPFLCPNVERKVLRPGDRRGQYGAFARRDLGRGSVLGAYKGVLWETSEFENQYANTFHSDAVFTYAITLFDFTVTAHDPDQRNDLTLINDYRVDPANPRRGQAGINVDFVPVWPKRGPPLMLVITTRSVRAGQELLLDYGPEYWNREPACGGILLKQVQNLLDQNRGKRKLSAGQELEQDEQDRALKAKRSKMDAALARKADTVSYFKCEPDRNMSAAAAIGILIEDVVGHCPKSSCFSPSNMEQDGGQWTTDISDKGRRVGFVRSVDSNADNRTQCLEIGRLSGRLCSNLANEQLPREVQLALVTLLKEMADVHVVDGPDLLVFSRVVPSLKMASRKAQPKTVRVAMERWNNFFPAKTGVCWDISFDLELEFDSDWRLTKEAIVLAKPSLVKI